MINVKDILISQINNDLYKTKATNKNVEVSKYGGVFIGTFTTPNGTHKYYYNVDNRNWDYISK